MTLTRAAALALAALAGYAAVVITVPGQASAATAYRYWAYYVAHGTSWQYSQRGPATEYPVDGEVQGWRFGVQVDAGNGLLPGAKPDFGTLCESTPAKAGEIRVGVVIDFGLATDAPAHERPPAGVVPGCVYVHDDATGASVVEAAAAVRIGTGSNVGLVCGIDGYPKTECAVAAAAHTTAPSAAPSAAPPAPAPTAAALRATASTPTAPSHSAGLGSALIVASSSAAQSASGPALSSAPVQSSAPPDSAAASALSLAALRSNTRHDHGFPAATVAGIALIVILGGAALWRTRVRQRAVNG